MSYYNPIQKEKFIASLDNKKFISNCKSSFKKTKAIEEELGKDLSEFNKDEILYMYKNTGYSYGTLATNRYVFMRYTDYVGKVNFYSMVSPKELRDCATEMICLSLGDLREITSKYVNDVDKAIVYLFFFGLSAYEISTVNEDKIYDKYLFLTRCTVELPYEVIALIKSACNCYTYKYFESDIRRSTSNPLDPYSKYMLKKRLAESDMDGNVTSMLSQRLDGLCKRTKSKKFNMVDLRRSGVVYHLRELQKAKGCDVDELFHDPAIGKNMEQYNYTSAVGVFKHMFKGYLNG